MRFVFFFDNEVGACTDARNLFLGMDLSRVWNPFQKLPQRTLLWFFFNTVDSLRLKSPFLIYSILVPNSKGLVVVEPFYNYQISVFSIQLRLASKQGKEWQNITLVITLCKPVTRDKTLAPSTPIGQCDEGQSCHWVGYG